MSAAAPSGDPGREGMVFLCDSRTQEECLDRMLLGLPRSRGALLQQLKPDTLLLLFNTHTRMFFGVFQAVGRGGLNLEPLAWGGTAARGSRFPVQIRFRPVAELAGLRRISEASLRPALSYIGHSNRFQLYLRPQQAARALELVLESGASLSRDAGGEVDSLTRAVADLQVSPANRTRVVAYEDETNARNGISSITMRGAGLETCDRVLYITQSITEPSTPEGSNPAPEEITVELEVTLKEDMPSSSLQVLFGQARDEHAASVAEASISPSEDTLQVFCPPAAGRAAVSLCPQRAGVLRVPLCIKLNHEITLLRFIVVRTIPPGAAHLLDEVMPSSPYRRANAANGQSFSRPHGNTIPGVRPKSKTQWAAMPNAPEFYPVPRALRHTLESVSADVGFAQLVQAGPAAEHRLIDGAPHMLPSQRLRDRARRGLEQYEKHFATALWVEEVQMEVDIRVYDLHQVEMAALPSRLLALLVPGLAEKRPSVLFGDRVYATDAAGQRWEGFVHQVLDREVYVRFSSKFHRSHAPGSRYDISFSFARTPLRRAHQALRLARLRLPPSLLLPLPADVDHIPPPAPPEEDDPGLPEAADLLPHLGFLLRAPAAESSIGPCITNEGLNAEQTRAVGSIVAASGAGLGVPFLLFGPPGTGKTSTVVEAIAQVVEHLPGSRVLACASSNSAADLLVQRLRHLSPSEMLRVNALTRSRHSVPADVLPYCGHLQDADTDYFTPPQVAQVRGARVVVSTCVSAGILHAMGVPDGHFSHVFVDEAGHTEEPECVVSFAAMLRAPAPDDAAAEEEGGRGVLILSGDPRQLGPIVRSPIARKAGLGVSMLERLLGEVGVYGAEGALNPRLAVKLVRNYRSHPAILDLPSRMFYHSALVPCADLAARNAFVGWDKLPRPDFPLVFDGLVGEDMREGSSPSWFNPDEALRVLTYVETVLEYRAWRVSTGDIGVVTPYRKQVQKLRRLLDAKGYGGVKVGSVEEFQGQERLVIIVTTVRSSPAHVGFDLRHNLGFLSNPKRANVTITRAKSLLIVVGNPHVLKGDESWNALLEYCRRNGAYRGCALEAPVTPTEEELGEDSTTAGAGGAVALDVSHVTQQEDPAWDQWVVV